jgi:hypothetical protein
MELSVVKAIEAKPSSLCGTVQPAQPPDVDNAAALPPFPAPKRHMPALKRVTHAGSNDREKLEC